MGCRHCGRQPAGRPRGLCWTCYQSLEIRCCYAAVSKFGRRGVLDFYGSPHIPAAPTAAPPGSLEKVAILQQRASRHESLWHPEDARGSVERGLLLHLSSA